MGAPPTLILIPDGGSNGGTTHRPFHDPLTTVAVAPRLWRSVRPPYPPQGRELPVTEAAAAVLHDLLSAVSVASYDCFTVSCLLCGQVADALRFQLVTAGSDSSLGRRFLGHANADKLMASLDPEGGGGFDLEPPRPKGMWHRTYEARLAEMRRLEKEATAVFMSALVGGYAEGSLEDWFT